jgi:hypothetical protein
MQNIASGRVLLRMQTDLPIGMDVAAAEFGEGWNLMLPEASVRLKKDVQAYGWNLIKFAHEPQGSGVGDTAEEATTAALRQSLRRISKCFNAAEVDRIEWTEYPWFFLARVLLSPYNLQEYAIPAVTDDALSHPVTRARGRLPRNSRPLSPSFNVAMPAFRQLLVLSSNTDGEAQ